MSLRLWQKAVEDRLRAGIPGQLIGFDNDTVDRGGT